MEGKQNWTTLVKKARLFRTFCRFFKKVTYTLFVESAIIISKFFYCNHMHRFYSVQYYYNLKDVNNYG